MLKYYCFLGLRSLRRNPILTGLMILTLAIGVAASVSTLTILHAMSANPMPGKSDRLLTAILDNGPAEGYVPGMPVDHHLTYRDTINLLASGQGERRTALYAISGTVEPGRTDLRAVAAEGLAVSKDFFAMFDAGFLHGQAWSEKEDSNSTEVIVLSRKFAEKLYGNANPVGQRTRIFDRDFQIVGVLKDWVPQPRFYQYNGPFAAFGYEDEFLIPFSTAIKYELPTNASTSCNRPPERGWQGFLDSECIWLNFWVEMKSGAQRNDWQQYLNHYTEEQRKSGRFLRRAPNEIFDVMQWLEKMQLIGSDTKLSVWLAFGFLLLCLVNTVGLLLAKFSVRASEIGVRRALGASKRQIFLQFLMESSCIGLAGGIAGLLLALGGIALIAMQSKQVAVIAHMDWTMLIATFVLSIFAAILAGLLPTWRACQVTPAIQLKTQ